MGEARSARDFGKERLQAAATIGAGDVIQLPTGKAGVLDRATALASTEYEDFLTAGTFTIVKTSGFVALTGNRAYWDHSANAVNYKKVNDRDFYIGRFAEDAVSAQTNCKVDLNADPPYDLDIARDPCLSVLVGTPAAGGFGYPVQRGGGFVLELTATNEAQKVDLLTRDGFDLAANAIVEFAFLIENDGSNATQDFSIGAASGTHASNFQTITSFVAVSTVGNSTAINAQSDDNSTDVAPTDTTATYTEGTAVAQRVEGWLDFRDPADVQVYIDGVLKLGSTVFSAGTSGTHFLIAHLEKTSGTDVYKVAVDWLRAHYAEQ